MAALTREDYRDIAGAQLRAAIRPGMRYRELLTLVALADRQGHDGSALYRDATAAYQQTAGRPAPTLEALRADPGGVVDEGSALAQAAG